MTDSLRIVAAMTMLSVSGGVCAQASYPEKPVRIIVGFTAGSSTADLISRLVGPKVSEWWRQPVIVENMPGQVANIAAARVAKAPPDGYTLVATGDAALTTNVSLYAKQLPYDPLKDLTPVTLAALSTNILVVHPSLPVRNVKELVTLAKANPGKLSYASAGSGSSQHLGGELLKKRAGIDMLHVPYKGGVIGMQDVIAGRVEMTFGNVAGTLTQVQAGKVRAIAVSSQKRWPALPDVPTVAESGLPRLRSGCMVRLFRAGRDAQRDRPEDLPGHGKSTGPARCAHAAARGRSRSRGAHAAGVRRADQVRDRGEGTAH